MWFLSTTLAYFHYCYVKDRDTGIFSAQSLHILQYSRE